MGDTTLRTLFDSSCFREITGPTQETSSNGYEGSCDPLVKLADLVELSCPNGKVYNSSAVGKVGEKLFAFPSADEPLSAFVGSYQAQRVWPEGGVPAPYSFAGNILAYGFPLQLSVHDLMSGMNY